MRAILLLLTALLLLPAAAFAADDGTPAQQVIRAQEQAFGRDDAASAYSHAAPAIRQMFPDAGLFMLMVQQFMH